MKHIILTTTALTLLGACSNGGGSGGINATPLKSFSEAVEQGGTYQTTGIVTSAAYTTNSDDEVTSVGDAETAPNAQLYMHIEEELLRAARVNQSGADFAFNEGKGAEIVGSEDGQVFVVVNEDETMGGLFADPAGIGFEYQSFGVWDVMGEDNAGRAAAGSFGVRTAADAMPTTGTASYSGQSAGQVVTDGQAYLTGSQVTLSTDFETVDMSSTDTTVVDMSTGNVTTTARPDLDFTASGDLDGSGFTSNIDTAGFEGSVNGQFYGPGAEEVGGTFAATTGGSNYMGAFGATQ
ncbi:transferrin-binding protein-like solute binding protein [Roseivivax sp. CAU 1761]